MISRRSFIAAAAGASALPRMALADTAEPFDPTPQYVRIKKDFLPGELLVLPRSFYLYFVTEPRKAIRYGCGVGKAGLEFTGRATIDVKKEWPTWRPTDEMIERDPHLYGKFIDNDYVQPGGPGNPLGARALYLFQNGVDTYFRIHGTTQPETIGRAVSNGCIRMLNSHVVDLYQRVPVGTVVTVL
ncbi:Lipoprotein-anchoring transpeptidase ErfK/SrfK [Cribrihabitans marinus]|uniref:Lipoprotein-anchoring transpeptidase ErfK/SrfK n=1 Tax=Cribrihabitans marinus TaxID=1227549 RepID=A0A1H7CUX3_9RHOB|nr:L,D-transpeptidase [Cribrihabitans marinus]GGH35942.1 carnitine operon oxidoreductase caia [Cribrihabitans marinus]SEJ90540.1 Lipoprotein-anchoring transpeptidase ErfK/SrfK [Cribrihabitans marinus]